MLRFAAVIACGLMLTGCAGGMVGQQQNWVSTTLSKEQVEDVQKGVRRSLKDPESARFGEIIAAKSDTGKLAVCGYVNAKNSFGGYIGMKPFAGTFASGGFSVQSMGGIDFETSITFGTCRSANLILLPLN